MKIKKSTRHSKITGDFGESLIMYWLSKYGFECALVDHTGIDIIARNPYTQEVMGVSVKSRSRTEGKETECVNITNTHFDMVDSACQAFCCIPYFALVVDADSQIQGFLLSMSHLLQLAPKGKRVSAWKMGQKYLEQYEKDPEIKSFKFETKTNRWW
jgi:Holliday junction resolvase-like predicted endonuclease